MNYRYLIISVCFSCFFVIQHWFANDQDIYGDCKLLKTQWYYNEYTSIYPEKLIEIAQKHLLAFCCSNKKEYLTNQNICKNITSDTYVDSPRLYDHLIDLGMRYLDGDSNLQYPQAPLDKQGEERRKWVTEYGKPTGWIPLELQTKYTQYRWTMIEDFDIIDSTKDCEKRDVKFAEYNTNRDTLSLAKKYFVLCELNSCMVDGEKNNRISACQSLVTERIIGERNYVQWLLLHQSTLALSTNFEAYALWYINHDKFMKLLEKIVMMSKWFGFVNNKVNEMTKTCSA
jgi:hypothetical protein